MCIFWLQYSAVFVKKHLLESLVNKIKVLKLLTYKHKVKEETILKTAERLCPNYVTPAFKDFLGLKKQKSVSPPKIGKNLVLTSRVKLIEETIKDNDEDIIGKTPISVIVEFHSTHNVWKLLKMSHSNFLILAFSTNFCPIKTDLSGNTVWPQA